MQERLTQTLWNKEVEAALHGIIIHLLDHFSPSNSADPDSMSVRGEEDSHLLYY